MNNEIKPEQIYKVGDIVKVKGRPVECAFTWVSGMNRYCGKEAIIEGVRYVSGRGWRYDIDLDRGWHGWCENCFEHTIPDLPEFSTEVSDLTSLFN